MNLKRTGRMFGFVAAVAMLAMVLQGCGSDGDGSGISQDMYDALQAELDDAEAAQMTAEAAAAAAMAAQMTAETAEAAAMEAQTMAEADAATAMAAQMTAEQARQAAVTAQQIAEAAEMEARTAETAAMAAQATAETMRDTYQQGQMDAAAERDMYKTAKMEADTMLAAAVTAREAAAAAAAAAKTAQAIAEAAKTDADTKLAAAETARDAALAAQATAEMELAELKKAMMEESDAANMAAVAAQRARVDAAAIQASADDVTTTTVVGGVAFTADTTTNTVEMFQGSGSVPGDGPDTALVQGEGEGIAANETDDAFVTRQGEDVDPTGELRPNRGNTNPATNPGVMTLTATRVGDTVTFKATADNDPTDATAAGVLINFEATAGADGMTSGMDEVDLPGQTKHIFLMSDIEAPSTGSFAGNKPDGLDNAADPAAGVTEFRYPVRTNWVYDPTDVTVADRNRPSVTADSESLAINLGRHGSIAIELGSFAPTAAAPTQEVQAGGRLPGSYAGVAGHFRCGNVADGGTAAAACTLVENADGEVIADGTWQFVPGATTIAFADADYLVFGAWLKKPDSAVGTGASAAISAGSDLFDVVVMTDDVNAQAADANNGIRALTGKAKYSGTAAGYFAERHVDGNDAESGTFTATAELTASFGTTAEDGGNISGKIDAFVRDDGQEVDWLVNLGTIIRSNVAGHMSNMNAGGFVMGNTSGTASGAPWAGEWGVQFAGNNTIPGGTTRSTTLHPRAVVGTFGAQHGSPSLVAADESSDKGFAAVIGGFGARKVVE